MIKRTRDLGRRLAELAVALILAASMTALFSSVAEHAAPVPGAADPTITQANIASTICTPGYTRRVRPPVEWTDAFKRRLLAEQLQTPADAARKDVDERRLHAEVCSGHMTLKQAQRELMERWP